MKKVLLTLAAVGLMAGPAMAAAVAVTGTAPSQTAGAGYNTAQYHSYDGLICTDCHTLHASEDGAAVDGDRVSGTWQDNSTGFGSLLFKGDFTDMCLSCHKQNYNTSATADLPSVVNSGWTAPIVMTDDGIMPANTAMPAGDFFFSNADFKKGHNPAMTKGNATGAVGDVASSQFMAKDDVLGSNPPGGTLTDTEWSCHSCHGMHSRFSSTYTAYRQLKRKVNGKVTTGSETVGFGVESNGGASGTTAAGYEPIKSNTRGDIIGGTNYTNVRPDGDPLDGASLFVAEGDTNKNVYRGGFSSFCSACHGDFHGGSTEGAAVNGGATATKAGQSANVRSGGFWLKHPTNLALGNAGATEAGSSTTIKAKYGVNNTTATKGGYNVTVTSSVGVANPNPVGYDWKYPLVVDDANSGNVLPNATSKDDALQLTGDERIMCLTCHKAHASQFENMTRWDTNAHAFIEMGATDFTGEASSGDNPAYGCGKCHQKGGAKAYVKSF